MSSTATSSFHLKEKKNRKKRKKHSLCVLSCAAFSVTFGNAKFGVGMLVMQNRNFRPSCLGKVGPKTICRVKKG